MDLLVAVLIALRILLQLYGVVLLLRVLMSWIRIDPYHPVARFLYAVTEPVLEPIRSILPQTGMIDFSPMVAMILAFALQQVVDILISGL